MNRPEKEILYKLTQKVDDLQNAVDQYMKKEAPLLAMIPTHEERLDWLRKAVIALYGIGGGTVLTGIVLAVVFKILGLESR